MFNNKQYDQYGRPIKSTRKRLFVIVIVLLIAGVIIAALSGILKHQKQSSIDKNLAQYNDALFTIQHPKDYTPNIVSDLETTFTPPSESPEIIKVVSSPSYDLGITIDNIDQLEGDGENDYTVEKTKLNDVDAAMVTGSGDDNTILKQTYVFYPDITWVVSVQYLPGSQLETFATSIIKSFKPTPVSERPITEDNSILPAGSGHSSTALLVGHTNTVSIISSSGNTR